MPSSREYLSYIMEQLAPLEGITTRQMMGEYIIYYQGKIAAELCDDRLLVNPVPAALALLPDAPQEPPYPGAKPMLLVEEVEDGAFLRELLAQSPAWWGHEDKAIYDNLIFLLPPHTAEELEEALGAPHPELEWVHPCGDAVFWSFDRQKYQKTNWWPRTAQEPAREWITIRTAGTVRKLAAL